MNGGWGRWSSYGSCSKTCGGGVKERTRQCNNPTPKHGGSKCRGVERDITYCAMIGCPGKNFLNSLHFEAFLLTVSFHREWFCNKIFIILLQIIQLLLILYYFFIFTV